MKSGTSQKLALNMISTTVMIQLGRVEDNKMVNMQLTNDKLVDRGTRMLMERVKMKDYEKAKELLQSNREEVSVREDEFIFIRDSNVVKRLKLEEILYAEAMGDYVKLHTPQRFFAIHSTLKSVEERLPASRFFRVHRSFVVALYKIETIQNGVLIINGKSIPVADAYRGALNKRMNIL